MHEIDRRRRLVLNLSAAILCIAGALPRPTLPTGRGEATLDLRTLDTRRLLQFLQHYVFLLFSNL